MRNRIDTFPDREGYIVGEFIRIALQDLIRQDLGGPDTFPQWGRLQ
jgi:hypothetical protein